MRVGVEIEFTGISRIEAAGIVASHFKTTVVEEEYTDKGETRQRFKVTDEYTNANWYIVEDRSIKGYVSGREVFYTEYMCELVSPVIDDFSDLYGILNELSDYGAVVNDSCGCHIHIDCPKEVNALDSIIRKFLRTQWDLPSAWGIPECRLDNYCKLFSKVFIKGYISNEYTSIEQVKDYFYNNLSNGESRDYYRNPIRYYALNIDSIHKRNTIEFRFFNSTLDSETFNRYLQYIAELQEG